MPRNWPITVVLSLLLISTGCSTLPDSKSLPPVEEVSPYAAKFRDRAIDLEPFLRGYPFSGVEAELEHGHLLYFESTPEGKWLRFMNVKSGRRVDLAEGRKVGDIDWATRSWWSSKYHPATGKFYISSDEANDEHTNIYALDLEEGKTERITDNDYTYAWGFSDDGELLGYVRRTGLKEPMVGCFRVRDMLTGQDREILCDAGGADRFTWSKVLFTPDNRSVILTIQHDGNRRTKSLARIDLYSSDIEYLIPPRVERFGVELMEGWIGEHEFLYRSSEEGYENIYHYDLRIRKSTRLTDIHDRLRNARLLDTDPPVIMAMLRRPHESEAQLIDARSGEVLASEIIDSWVKIVDTDGSSGIFSVTDLTKPFSLEWFSALRRDGEWRIERQAMAAMPAELKEKIVHVEPERVSYPTFDKLADGSPRMIHAFYLEPTRPPTDPADRLVLITAFYGGGNYYSEKTNILAAAGIASFSPAPRGSHDFGAEFAALNDGDLGGDEIIDIIYAARWLVEHKGYKPHQIGVHGGSHGG
jgi:dipeptidyl aminopeptidase/acylaminoacyl peptidase